MKIERVNIVIPRDINKHIKYLNNEVMDIAARIKVGGLYTNDRIELKQIINNDLRLFRNRNIRFEVIAWA